MVVRQGIYDGMSILDKCQAQSQVSFFYCEIEKVECKNDKCIHCDIENNLWGMMNTTGSTNKTKTQVWIDK